MTEELYIKALNFLNQNPLKHLSTLKYLQMYKNKVNISMAEDSFDWALIVSIPTICLSYDSANYPDAKKAIFINGTSDNLKHYLLSNLPPNNYVLRTNENIELSCLMNRFRVSTGNSYISYTCSADVGTQQYCTLPANTILNDDAIELITKNGYTTSEIRKYFDNGALWFGYIENVEIKSICFVYKNYNNIWEIAGVHTPEAHRGKGFARIVVSSAIRHLLKKCLMPRYEADVTNIKSIRLAEKLEMKQFLRIDHYLLNSQSF